MKKSANTSGSTQYKCSYKVYVYEIVYLSVIVMKNMIGCD